jgi:hypothetical protein
VAREEWSRVLTAAIGGIGNTQRWPEQVGVVGMSSSAHRLDGIIVRSFSWETSG